MLRNRRKNKLKLLVIGLSALAALIMGGALALAQPVDLNGFAPSGAVGTLAAPTPATPAIRATLAVAALRDAHPGDQAVAYIASIAQREVNQPQASQRPGAEQILGDFSARAEEHLIAGSRNPAEAQQLLRTLVQQLRGTTAGALHGPAREAEQPASQLSAFGRDLLVGADTTAEEVSVVGGNLTVRGHVLRDAVAVGGNVQVDPGGRIDGDVIAVGGNVRLEPGTRIDGDAVSVGGHTSIADGAYVGGDRTQVGTGTLTRPLAEGPVSGGVLKWLADTARTIGLGLVMALLCIVIAALAPNRVRTVISTIRRRPAGSFIAGALALVVTFTASFLLAITLIGIPLIPVVWLGLGLAALFGMSGAAAIVGEVLPGKGRAQRSALRSIVLGVAFLTLVSLLPHGVGWILIILLSAVALGAVILSRVGAVDPQR